MFWPQRMSSAEMGLLRDFPGGPMVKTPYFSAQNKGLIPGQGTKIPHATWCGQKKKTHTHTHTEMGLLYPCLPEGSNITQLVDGLVGLSAASRH